MFRASASHSRPQQQHFDSQKTFNQSQHATNCLYAAAGNVWHLHGKCQRALRQQHNQRKPNTTSANLYKGTAKRSPAEPLPRGLPLPKGCFLLSITQPAKVHMSYFFCPSPPLPRPACSERAPRHMSGSISPPPPLQSHGPINNRKAEHSAPLLPALNLLADSLPYQSETLHQH